MKSSELKTENKRAFANEIVNIFKKVKISLLTGLIWFIGFSVYNKLFEYSLFDYSFGWAEAEEILGYRPSQYNFVVLGNENPKIDQEYIRLLDEWHKARNTPEELQANKRLELYLARENKNTEFGAPTYGSMEISGEGRLEVKKDIISKLFENSAIFALVMSAITFVVLMLIHYLNKAINWTKKYAD
ncbi:MAG: hypothetical protein ACI7YS_08090 [Flavobacterium sp.]